GLLRRALPPASLLRLLSSISGAPGISGLSAIGRAPTSWLARLSWLLTRLSPCILGISGRSLLVPGARHPWLSLRLPGAAVCCWTGCGIFLFPIAAEKQYRCH